MLDQPLHVRDSWHADTLDSPVATLSSGNVRDGEDLIPSLSYPLPDFYADPPH